MQIHVVQRAEHGGGVVHNMAVVVFLPDVVICTQKKVFYSFFFSLLKVSVMHFEKKTVNFLICFFLKAWVVT